MNVAYTQRCYIISSSLCFIRRGMLRVRVRVRVSLRIQNRHAYKLLVTARQQRGILLDKGSYARQDR